MINVFGLIKIVVQPNNYINQNMNYCVNLQTIKLKYVKKLKYLFFLLLFILE